MLSDPHGSIFDSLGSLIRALACVLACAPRRPPTPPSHERLHFGAALVGLYTKPPDSPESQKPLSQLSQLSPVSPLSHLSPLSQPRHLKWGRVPRLFPPKWGPAEAARVLCVAHTLGAIVLCSQQAQGGIGDIREAVVRTKHFVFKEVWEVERFNLPPPSHLPHRNGLLLV